MREGRKGAARDGWVSTCPYYRHEQVLTFISRLPEFLQGFFFVDNAGRVEDERWRVRRNGLVTYNSP
jgi:hypothetical protein